MINKNQLEDLIKRTLKELHSETMQVYSSAAVNLLLGTAAQESGLGTYIRQIGGPAMGIFQMEKATEKDIWENYLKYNPAWCLSIEKALGYYKGSIPADAIESNLKYQIIMARMHYKRVPVGLPADNNLEYLAKYWKDHYNTHLGKGTTEEFENNYYRYILGK